MKAMAIPKGKALPIALSFGSPDVFTEQEPVISMTYPLNQIAQAHEKLEAGGAGLRGKIIVNVS